MDGTQAEQRSGQHCHADHEKASIGAPSCEPQGQTDDDDRHDGLDDDPGIGAGEEQLDHSDTLEPGPLGDLSSLTRSATN